MEFTDEAENEEQDDDQNNVLEVLSSKESTTPIPLAHASNSSDISKEAGLSNSFEAEDNYYKILLKDCMKDCVYFDKEVDSTLQLMKETNEEMPDNSDDDDRYGGYNEYSERD